MGYFHDFVSETWELIFAVGKAREILCHFFSAKIEEWVAQLCFLLDRSTLRKENFRPKYLKRNGINDICTGSLTDKQTKRTYLHSDGWMFRTKQWNVCLVTLCLTTLFAIKQHMVYSECIINANILFSKETKTITYMYVKYNNETKLIWQRDTWVNRLQLTSDQMACSDRLFWVNCILLVLPQAIK